MRFAAPAEATWMFRCLEALRLSGRGALIGPSWGALRAFLGALGTLPGPPDRYDANTCWLLDLYGDFGLALGVSSEPHGSLMGNSWAALAASWRILGAPWRPLGELLGGVYGSSTCSISNLLHYRMCFEKVFISRAKA